MLSILRGETVRKALVKLPESIRAKFAKPAVPHVVHDFIGETEQQLLARAIQEVAYADDCNEDGHGRDGNWEEYTKWTGLTDGDMDVIRHIMYDLGWQIGDTEF